MKRSLLLALWAACLGCTSPPQDSLAHAGEVVSLDCYLYAGKRGAGHAECAEASVWLGVPAGLLTAEGELYLLVPDVHAHPDGMRFSGYAGQACRVEGRVAERAGMRALMVRSIAPLE